MAITKQKKIEIVDKFKMAVSSAVSLVFVNFHGLTVVDSTKLRKALKSKSIGYTVGKKTLIKRALDETKTEGELPSLDGEVAVVYGKDPIEPAREIFAFLKEHKDKMKILGGVFEGKYMDALAMTEIATIPPKEVLYGKLVYMFANPVRGLAIALSEIAKSKEGSVA
jgi:large subunit ribosomal protein L10